MSGPCKNFQQEIFVKFFFFSKFPFFYLSWIYLNGVDLFSFTRFYYFIILRLAKQRRYRSQRKTRDVRVGGPHTEVLSAVFVRQHTDVDVAVFSPNGTRAAPEMENVDIRKTPSAVIVRVYSPMWRRLLHVMLRWNLCAQGERKNDFSKLC